MRLGFFTMPIHPLDKDWRLSLREDREAFIAADALGYSEGYVGEHVTDAAENITSSALFIATLAHATTQIRLGTGTVNIPNRHPAGVAAEIAMLDHLLDGRLMFGVSPGGLMSDAEIFGNLKADRAAMFVEGMEHILALWAGEAPYDLTGQFWTISTRNTLMAEIGQGIVGKPLQRPHPPIIVTAASPNSSSVVQAGQRGWEPISANFLLPQWVATHWPGFVKGCESAGRTADPAQWRVAKSIFVAEDRDVARRYVEGPDSPYRFYYSQLIKKLAAGRRLSALKSDPSEPDESVTADAMLDRLVIYGDPSEVADGILAFRDQVGPFGTLLYAGHDWQSPDLALQSMQLMARTVMPKINAAIGEPN
jgi:alkanesulfonate monooxygenase SsuD/methylene tetrahydromethanopterin reductase-like flavin-dependent oxidoreductase (luciferase family)